MPTPTLTTTTAGRTSTAVGGSSRLAVAAIVTAFVGLSIGSTVAKAADAPGPVVAFWRFAIGAAVWHAVVARRRARGDVAATAPAAWRAAVLPGIAFGVSLSCFFAGVTRTPVAHAEFISASAPVVAVPLAAWLLGERPRRGTALVGATALCGVALIVSRSPAGGTSVVGDALVVVSMLAWVVHLLTASTARRVLGTAEFMAIATTAAGITALPGALAVAGGPADLVALPARTWVLVAVLALVAGVASHGLIAWGNGRVAVGTISMLQLAQPALGVLWAATFLGEAVGGVQVAGMAIVLAAVGTIAARSTRGHR